MGSRHQHEFVEVRIAVPATDADRIASALVEERLAACVQAVPGLRSTFQWQGSVETADETLLLAKTTAAHFDALASRVTALHPYDVAEILAVPIVAVTDAYAEWLRAAVDSPPCP